MRDMALFNPSSAQKYTCLYIYCCSPAPPLTPGKSRMFETYVLPVRHVQESVREHLLALRLG